MFEFPGQVPQIDHQLSSCLVAAIGQLLEALERDPLQLGRYVVVESGDGHRLGMHDVVQDLSKAGTLERSLAGGQLVEDDAQAEDVGAMEARESERDR